MRHLRCNIVAKTAISTEFFAILLAAFFGRPAGLTRIDPRPKNRPDTFRIIEPDSPSN
jgi:hypothetical protein